MKYKKECDRMLESLVGKGMVDKWWQSPNKAFGDKKPIDVFETDPRSVVDYLMGHCYGGEYS